MATVRVRDNGPWIVTHPEHGANVTLKPGDPWDAKDIVVKTFEWAFQTDGERDVEDATAEPGRKRATKRST